MTLSDSELRSETRTENCRAKGERLFDGPSSSGQTDQYSQQVIFNRASESRAMQISFESSQRFLIRTLASISSSSSSALLCFVTSARLPITKADSYLTELPFHLRVSTPFPSLNFEFRAFPFLLFLHLNQGDLSRKMAYNQQQGGYSGYSDYPQHPQYGNSAQPELPYSQNYAQDPFASRASFDQPSSYPPHHRPYSGESQGKTGSTWSLDEQPVLAGGAGAGGAAYSAVSRDKSNPFSKEFKSGNKPPGNRVRKWIWIIAALIVVM